VISLADMGLAQILKSEYGEIAVEEVESIPEFKTQVELDAFIAKLEAEMREAAKRFEFEKAARLRDSIKELREKEFLFG
ncbi:MAG: UvrB/UvrC motif-containing protein, partial [Terracidiphilus sp.]